MTVERGRYEIVQLHDATTNVAQYAVVKRQEDDPSVWGIVAWALNAPAARRKICDIVEREHALAGAMS